MELLTWEQTVATRADGMGGRDAVVLYAPPKHAETCRVLLVPYGIEVRESALVEGPTIALREIPEEWIGGRWSC